MISTWKFKAVIIILIICSSSSSVITLKSNSQEISNLSELRKSELLLHNAKRKLHRCSPLVINETLNIVAQKYADQLAKKKVLAHSKPAVTGKYGENLYKAWGFPSYSYPVAGATNSWYSQINDYDFKESKAKVAGKVIGHFTAIVWKQVTSVGFGFVKIKQNNGYSFYVVANYYPAPNVVGKYKINVFPINGQ